MKRVNVPIDLQLAIDPGKHVIPESVWFEEWLALTLKELNRPKENHEVCLRICDQHESRSLNMAFRQIDNPTNVLSFPANIEFDEVPQILGDVVICWDIMIDQARDQNKELNDHVSHLFVHGLLHLLGYTHELAHKEFEMEEIEIKVLAKKGLPNPYLAL